MSDDVDLIDPEFVYDTVGMEPEDYEALPVKPVFTPPTRRFNIHEMFGLTKGSKADRKIEIAKIISTIPAKEFELLQHKWRYWARHNQIAPVGLWTYWVLLAGRGFGKTRTGAEWIHEKVENGTAKRIALVAPTAADVRKVMVEGESGLLATAKPWNRPHFEPSKLQLTWPNGAIAQMFSAEEPERLRGPQCDTFWADEVAAWKNMQMTWDMLQFGFRLGKHPQGCITTTPKPVPIIKGLVLDQLNEDKKVLAGELDDSERTVALTKGSTYDNKGNLATPFFQKVVSKYEGTRLGRQELDAEILEDMPGALWSRDNLDANRIRTDIPPIQAAELKEIIDAPKDSPTVPLRIAELKARAAMILLSAGETMTRITVNVDPNASNDEGSDEIGITVTGKGISGRGYVIADMSMRGSPNDWASTAVLAHDIFTADRIVGEANQGGNMVDHTITSAAKFLKIDGKRASDFIPVTLVHATRGKVTRAEPVSALYEQNRITHLGTHTTLEDQMCLFTSDFDRKAMGYSPDRVDALVWGFTQLFLEANDTGILEFYQQIGMKKQALLAAKLDPANRVKMSVPIGVSSVFGRSGNSYSVEGGFVFVEPEDVPGLRNGGLAEATS